MTIEYSFEEAPKALLAQGVLRIRQINSTLSRNVPKLTWTVASYVHNLEIDERNAAEARTWLQALKLLPG
jgi:hypothetical protein